MMRFQYDDEHLVLVAALRTYSFRILHAALAQRVAEQSTAQNRSKRRNTTKGGAATEVPRERSHVQAYSELLGAY